MSRTSTIVVVDASVFVDVLLGNEQVAHHLAGTELHVPVTVDAEVVHSLRRQWLAGFVDEERARIAIQLFSRRHVTRHPVVSLMDRMWELRRNVTAYDAAYVALAEVLDSPLLTRDLRLSRSTGHTATIHYID